MFSKNLILAAVLLIEATNALPALSVAAAAKFVPRVAKADVPIHIISARGTNEMPGPGNIGNTISNMMKAQTTRDIVLRPVNYPASYLNGLDYTNSVIAGVADLTKQIKRVVKFHPRRPIVILGYSQGAQVVGNTLCGWGNEGAANYVAPLDPELASHIVSAIWAGDPAHVASQPFVVGNGTVTGVNPRQWNIDCSANNLTNVITSYCIGGDPYCDSGSNMDAHHSYMATYGQTAAATVLGQVFGNTTTTEPTTS